MQWLQCNFELWISHSTLPTKAPVPAGEKQSLSMKLMPPCFAVWMVFFWKCAVLFSTKHLLWLWPWSSALFSSDHNTSFHVVWGLGLWCFFVLKNAAMLSPYPVVKLLGKNNLFFCWNILNGYQLACSTVYSTLESFKSVSFGTKGCRYCSSLWHLEHSLPEWITEAFFSD